MTDAPRHTHLRGLISRAFTPKRVRTIEDQIQRQAVTIVGAAVDQGSVELVADLSMQLPLWTISEMLGVPEDRRRELWDGANALVNAQARADAGDDEADALAEALMAGISLSSLGVDFANTWSCYKGGDLHCGVCGTCVERREAFLLAGLTDPTLYEQTPALPTL